MDLLKNYDLRLAQRACEGDKTAFQEIVEENKKKIFYLAYDLTGTQQDAEDLSQEVFIKAFKYIKNFKGEATLSSWLYRITLNAYLDQKRKISTKIEATQMQLDERIQGSNPFYENSCTIDPENYAEFQQIQHHINRALNHLTNRERSVFVLRHYQGLPGREVGDILSISEGTVKSLLSRAIKKLQKALKVYHKTPKEEVYQ
jgi:RNA polymerase sigma-70 factor (ECF subfamily)